MLENFEFSRQHVKWYKQCDLVFVMPNNVDVMTFSWKSILRWGSTPYTKREYGGKVGRSVLKLIHYYVLSHTLLQEY